MSFFASSFPAAAGGPQPPALAQRRRILIVDDSRTVRALVRRELQHEAYEIFEAASGAEALTVIQSGVSPDLITLDVEMPEMDGFTTCEKLYSREFVASLPPGARARVPVIFLTASDSLAHRQRGFELGALDFVPKDFEPGELAVVAARILHAGDELQDATALVIDDSPTVVQAVSTGLREAGATVLEATSSTAAFEAVCNTLGSLDILVTDLEMPGMDGFELCRRIRHELGLTDLPIIVLSAHSQQAQRLAAFRAGASDYLVKPFTKEEMIARLRAHIERHRLERRLRGVVKELATSLRTKDELIATLSHDMRTPLHGLLGCADILLGDAGLPAPAHENVRLIKDSGRLVLGLIDDILTLSKARVQTTGLDLQPLALSGILAHSVRVLHPLAARKQITLHWENKAAADTVAGHRESLLRVANNLIGNAIKFTPHGGRIDVRLSLGAPAADSAPGEPPPLILAVTDTGVGIAPERLARLFERFTPHARPGTAGEAGTGLGLYIVKQLIDQHHGHIEVASAPQRGTEIRVRLPLSSQTPAPGDGAALPRAATFVPTRRFDGLRVLVADDDAVSQRVAEHTLKRLGCEVQLASTGTEALTLLAHAPHPFQLVFMDVEMPQLDGRSVTRLARTRLHLSTPILGLTGHTDPLLQESCIRDGMNAVLVKPLAAAALEAAVVRWCESRTERAPLG